MSTSTIAVVGRIGAPYGVKGWTRVQSFTDPSDNIIAYLPWSLARAEEGPWREVSVAETRAHRGGFVAKFVEAGDRDAAEALRGCWIGVESAMLAAPEENEYFWRDLEGCVVVNTQGLELGRVDHLLQTGVHDVLVLDKASLMIPFVAAYVLAVDTARARIEVDWNPDWNE